MKAKLRVNLHSRPKSLRDCIAAAIHCFMQSWIMPGAYLDPWLKQDRLQSEKGDATVDTKGYSKVFYSVQLFTVEDLGNSKTYDSKAQSKVNVCLSISAVANFSMTLQIHILAFLQEVRPQTVHQCTFYGPSSQSTLHRSTLHHGPNPQGRSHDKCPTLELKIPIFKQTLFGN